MNLPSATTSTARGAERPIRVCIATPDIVGPIRNGGIGTAYYALARTLVEAGHDVTILYVLGAYSEQDSIASWQRRYRRQGIRFVPLVPESGLPLTGPDSLQRPYHVYHWLRRESFDVIHFPEWQGSAYFCVLAKRQGLHFASTILCVGTHSPTAWHRAGQMEPVDSVVQLEIDFLERESVALADVVASPSHYMLDWLKDNGWTLPQTAIVRQNLIWEGLISTDGEAGAEPSAVTELVFFGRLERRKGLVLFCEALDLLRRELPGDLTVKVTFLGKGGRLDGEDSAAWVRSRAAARGQDWQILTDRDHAAAMRYLSHPGRLAVIPSMLENSPYTVLECLCAGVPFVASAVGGIPELIPQQRHGDVLFAPHPKALAACLGHAVRAGVLPAAPAVSPADNRQQWIDWHRAQADTPPVRGPRPARPLPKVSVCVCHFNRPRDLAQALASLRAQDYPEFEVVLVDDGSTDDDAVRYLASLEAEFRERGWQLIRQPNLYLGAARNNAARHASGEYLLFMDDDNVAKPGEISRFVDAALASGADVLTCFMDLFEQFPPSAPEPIPFARWLPTGGAAAASLFYNYFGDANALIRRSVFEAVGGFTEDYGLGHEDWEFFARVVLKGYRLEVHPDALFWYRVAETSMVRTTPPFENHMRSLRPYVAAMPTALRDLVPITYGLWAQRPGGGMFLGDLEEPESLVEWQRLLDSYWDSTSWRLTSPLRRLTLRLRGSGNEQRPRARNVEEARQLIIAMRESASWELTGPLRVLIKTWRHLRRKPAAVAVGPAGR